MYQRQCRDPVQSQSSDPCDLPAHFRLEERVERDWNLALTISHTWRHYITAEVSTYRRHCSRGCRPLNAVVCFVCLCIQSLETRATSLAYSIQTVLVPPSRYHNKRAHFLAAACVFCSMLAVFFISHSEQDVVFIYTSESK